MSYPGSFYPGCIAALGAGGGGVTPTLEEVLIAGNDAVSNPIINLSTTGQNDWVTNAFKLTAQNNFAVTNQALTFKRVSVDCAAVGRTVLFSSDWLDNFVCTDLLLYGTNVSAPGLTVSGTIRVGNNGTRNNLVIATPMTINVNNIIQIPSKQTNVITGIIAAPIEAEVTIAATGFTSCIVDFLIAGYFYS